MQVKVNDQVWIKDIKQYGVVESVEGEKVRVKLTTGQTIEVMNIVIEVLERLPDIFGWVKSIIKRVGKIFKK